MPIITPISASYAAPGTRDEVLDAAIRRIAELQAALRQQHMWHLAQTEPDQYGLIPANEYQDSAMCERTLAALQS